MTPQPFYDLESAKETLAILKGKLQELDDLSSKGEKAMAEYDLETADAFTLKIHKIFDEINQMGIIIRDQDATLFDFPAVINNIPAYLCWTTKEEDIEYWHYADEGFPGRKRLTGKEKILGYL